MKPFRILALVGAILLGSGCAALRAQSDTPACTFEKTTLPVRGQSAGAYLDLPKGAEGPQYESDDYYQSRPTWRGQKWRVHFVYGNGGLTEFMDDARCCALGDAEMGRRVCIGEYIRYGAMADIWHVSSPDKVTSVQVSVEPGGLTENEALTIVASTVTQWESK